MWAGRNTTEGERVSGAVARGPRTPFERILDEVQTLSPSSKEREKGGARAIQFAPMLLNLPRGAGRLR